MKKKSFVFKLAFAIGVFDFLFWSGFNFLFFHTTRSHWMETIQIPLVVIHLPVFLIIAHFGMSFDRLFGGETAGYISDTLGGIEIFAIVYLLGKIVSWTIRRIKNEKQTP